jgi:HlyD family secretion protein
MASQIFRKVALERLSSPEQLDMLMKISTPKGWLSILAIGGLLICAVIWGIWGTIPEKVRGRGILVKTGGVYNIVSTTSGRIQNLYFDVGDIVQKGQIVARVEQPELLAQIKEVKAKSQQLEQDRSRTAEFGTEEMALERKSMLHQKTTIESSIAVLRERIKWLKERLKNQKVLFRKGLITKQQLLNTEEQLDSTKLQIRAKKSELHQIKLKELQFKSRQKKELANIDNKIEETKRVLQRLQEDLNESSKILSSYTGRILEISVDEGTLVNRGTKLMSMDLMGKEIKNLEAVLYFSPREGKSIRLGMLAQISPATVKQEKYGYLKGLVTYVSEFPSTFQGMMRVLQNEGLVKALSGGGAPIEVRADLIPDPSTPSGYKWSSSKGPPIKIQTGTVCGATITVSQQRPMNLVIPLFKKHVLGIGEE